MKAWLYLSSHQYLHTVSWSSEEHKVQTHPPIYLVAEVPTPSFPKRGMAFPGFLGLFSWEPLPTKITRAGRLIPCHRHLPSWGRTLEQTAQRAWPIPTNVRERHLPLVVTCLLSVWVIHQTSGCPVASEILDKGLLSLYRTLHHNKSALSQTGQLISLTIFPKPSTSAWTSICKPHTTGQMLKDASDNCIRLVNTGRLTQISPWNNHLQLGQTKCEKYILCHKVSASPFWY